MSATNPAIMADNPLNKIPTLVCPDGTAIQDSFVICAFLDDLAGGDRLFPSTGARRWRSLSLHALSDGLLDLLILWRNERDKPPERQTAAWLQAFEAKATATLDRYEADVETISAQPLCIGQIALGCALGYLDFRFPDLGWRNGRPALSNWFATFSKRPSAMPRRSPMTERSGPSFRTSACSIWGASWLLPGRRRCWRTWARRSSRSSVPARVTTRAAGGRRSSAPRREADRGESGYYLSVNRGKRSVTIDIATAEGQDLVRTIARSAMS